MARPVVGASFGVIVALEDTKVRGEKFSRNELYRRGYRLTEKEWNLYNQLCKDELNLDYPVEDMKEETLDQAA